MWGAIFVSLAKVINSSRREQGGRGLTLGKERDSEKQEAGARLGAGTSRARPPCQVRSCPLGITEMHLKLTSFSAIFPKQACTLLQSVLGGRQCRVICHHYTKQSAEDLRNQETHTIARPTANKNLWFSPLLHKQQAIVKIPLSTRRGKGRDLQYAFGYKGWLLLNLLMQYIH